MRIGDFVELRFCGGGGSWALRMKWDFLEWEVFGVTVHFETTWIT